MHKKGFYERFIKRPMDFILSFMALIVLSPVLIVVAILVRIKLGSPVLFKQARPGQNEKIFHLYKFRTMTNQKDAQGSLFPDDIRLTKFGKFLRSTSLDELPSLLNILKGDLSIVGPRPLLVQYLPLYNDEQRRRHEVRPGLTGLAQVNGRNATSWERRFDYDVNYVDNITLLTDMRVMLLTIKKVIIREGITSSDSVTMRNFEGNKKI
ncbi:Undecaprenyl-phosphate galactose phosphotransferase [Paracholeplasma brassicae]|uniref:Undecaprenyl-phosphate galactose phosphotransferase n=1 Tax=Acholeplasma brassicae TaxID=61635 RepID=U4KM52_9MOLU|nr:sugar transferase [Paracholeplasma brassicae]CCV65100.1 Undecaprenyl-phosphate galactose phosphotransferase [Paracholeplasma brassicae]